MRKVNLLRCDVARDASMQDLFSELRDTRVAQLAEQVLHGCIARDVTAQQIDLSHVFALPYLCNVSVWKVWTNIPLFKQGAKHGA